MPPRMASRTLPCWLLLVILIHSIHGYSTWYGSSGGTCANRCGQQDWSAPCQCNAHCVKYSDCCPDYSHLCVSCKDRCGDLEDKRARCQCNTHCTRFGDCCDDYQDVCLSDPDSVPKGTISDEKLKTTVAELWNLDVNRFQDNQYTLNINGKKLFSYVNEALLLKGTWPLFLTLLDNYIPETGKAEPPCSRCRKEEDTFLNASLGTDVMRRTWEVLSQHGFASNNINDFKAALKQCWFLPYSRSGGPLDSSGFEHVFVGEINKGSVSGFHNWQQFYQEEKAKNLKYDRHVSTCKPNSMSAGVTWLGYSKSSTSFLVGTSPEFELAVYTICFLTRPDQICTVSYGGRTRKVSSYQMPGAKQSTVGTAHVLC